ncbi:NUDIX domain-containing protein [Ramlibacter sp. AN1015]|uniref:NUDIX domain-containing protein n=1 Tax=Ramlibacter sp. AN1015 TaxID=3133428 RepID=UPI0030BD412A
MNLALCVGPFDIPSDADLALLRRALALAPQCVVAIAGACLPRSPRHPFTWQERAELLLQALSSEERARVRMRPLRQWWDPARTAADLAQSIPAQAPVLLLRGPEAPALEAPPHWQEYPVGADAAAPSPQRLRELLFGAGAPAAAAEGLRGQVPANVHAFLERWTHEPAFRTLRAEHAQIAAEQAAWSVAPYPVVLVTVDVVLRCAGHVLLVRRGRSPGKGLYALPGGFLDPGETLRDGALRELLEETRLPLPPHELHAALRCVRVFDAPERSQRGRVITHAHYLDLGDAPLPPVSGADDAAAAEWVPNDSLPALEDRFLDDHFHVLEQFLPLSRVPLPT